MYVVPRSFSTSSTDIGHNSMLFNHMSLILNASQTELLRTSSHDKFCSAAQMDSSLRHIFLFPIPCDEPMHARLLCQRVEIPKYDTRNCLPEHTSHEFGAHLQDKSQTLVTSPIHCPFGYNIYWARTNKCIKIVHPEANDDIYYQYEGCVAAPDKMVENAMNAVCTKNSDNATVWKEPYDWSDCALHINIIYDMFGAIMHNFYAPELSVMHMIRYINNCDDDFDNCDRCVFHGSVGNKKINQPIVACARDPVVPAEYPIPETYEPYNCSDGSLLAKAQVCDGKANCPGEEDEAHCNYVCSSSSLDCFSACLQPQCTCHDSYYMCDGGGCLHYDKLCDGKPDCAMADDENDCFATGATVSLNSSMGVGMLDDAYILKCKSGDQVYDERAICHYDTVGDKITPCADGTHLGSVGVCMDFECFQAFKCLYSYCIPIRKVCDGVLDCPSQEDENKCDNYTCPGHLKCTDQSFCVPRWELCDGISNCPYGDDEKYCQSCPQGCSCIGSVLSCNGVERPSQITLYQSPAALILTKSTDVFNILSVNGASFLRVFSLHLVGGQLSSIPKLTADMFPVLRVLHLVKLDIVTISKHFFDGVYIKYLNLSFNKIYLIEYGAFDSMVNMKILSLVSNAIAHLKWYFYHKLEKLEHLYISNNPLTDIAPSLFAHNPDLLHVESDWYMVCCVASQTTVRVCTPQDDGVSSCQNLLHSMVQLLVILIQTLAVIIGNLAALILRKLSQKPTPEAPLAYGLTIADLLMGVYLCIVASMAFLYRDSFYLIISSWTKSPLCLFMSVVNFLSSECSLLMLTLLSVVKISAY